MIAERAFPKDAKRVRGQELGKLAISPGASVIVAGGGTFHNECMVWDWKSNSTKLHVFNGSRLQFINDDTLVAFANDQGGNRSTRYSLKSEKISMLFQHSVPVEDVGGKLTGDWATESASFFAGDLGIGIVSTRRPYYENQRGVLRTERYSSLIGLPSPDLRFSCVSRDGSTVVLEKSGGLVVFSHRAGVRLALQR